MTPSLEHLSQLLLVGFNGPAPDESVCRFLESTPPAGIILFRQNIVSQVELRDTLREIQQRCARPGRPPLLVAIDQEGGRVVRLTGDVGFPTFPSAAVMSNSPAAEQMVRDAASRTATGLQALGINMNCAPVLDVVTDPANRVIGDRSYGSDPSVVEELGLAAISATQNMRVAAVAKHFPGHGATAVDSHFDLPVIMLGRSEMDAIHLPPFRSAAHAGVAAIMTAHAHYPKLDPEFPSTLSRRILTGVLRDEWGYEGVIVTDSLTMGAIGRRQPIPGACVASLAAGADLLLIPGSPPLYRQCLDAIAQAVEEERIPRDQIEKALARVLRLRSWVG